MSRHANTGNGYSGPDTSLGGPTAAHWTPDELLAVHKSLLESEMAHGVLHDANNMLMVAETNLADLAGRSPEADSELQDLSQAIEAIGRALGALYRFSRGDASAALLPRLVQDARPMLQYVLTKKIKVEIDAAEDDIFEAPRGRWLHALMAMALLARLSLPKSGSIRISVACRRATEPANTDIARLCLETSLPENRLPGSDADPALHVKQGLALLALNDIAVELNGRFQATSDAGAMRWILEAPCRSVDSTQTQSLGPKEGHVIIADANEYARSMIQSALRGEGWTVSGGSALSAALDAWRDRPGSVLIVDGQLLSESDGDSVGELFDAGRRVIVLRPAGHAAPMDWERSALPILQKPFVMGELSTLVKIALNADPHKETDR